MEDNEITTIKLRVSARKKLKLLAVLRGTTIIELAEQLADEELKRTGHWGKIKPWQDEEGQSGMPARPEQIERAVLLQPNEVPMIVRPSAILHETLAN